MVYNLTELSATIGKSLWFGDFTRIAGGDDEEGGREFS